MTAIPLGAVSSTLATSLPLPHLVVISVGPGFGLHLHMVTVPW